MRYVHINYEITFRQKSFKEDGTVITTTKFFIEVDEHDPNQVAQADKIAKATLTKTLQVFGNEILDGIVKFRSRISYRERFCHRFKLDQLDHILSLSAV